MDLSPTVYKEITGLDPNRLKVRWRFVDCPNPGTLQVCLKEGSNPNWVAVQPTNGVVGVKSVTVNGGATTMLDGAYYYVSTTSNTDLSAVKVAVTSINGEVISGSYSLSAGNCTDTNKQFASSSGGDTSQQQSPATDAPSTATTAPETSTTAPEPATETPAATNATPTTTAPTQTYGSNNGDQSSQSNGSNQYDQSSQATGSTENDASSAATTTAPITSTPESTPATQESTPETPSTQESTPAPQESTPETPASETTNAPTQSGDTTKCKVRTRRQRN
ncbi:RxLR-like protein [Phytophthora cinnamomi]|uniref:RxLR-like protein n=1 Tax=Phytophthora cinnamomi TaxID=4785 RepID=UPI0035596356|nr:RxLR-like protein [Phytophthora cinnamomi]